MASKLKTLYTVLRFALKSPSNIKIIANKVATRLLKKRKPVEKQDNLKWINANCSDYEALAKKINADLWAEAVAYSESFTARSRQILEGSPIAFGGGGIYPFLYFITRLRKPKVIVETGVAAGFSSQTFLSAIKKNETGFLYSSDFPYFRFADSEKYIGILVEDDLKKFWQLHKNGDEVNLPLILKEINEIDIFHYDSDKTYQGRTFATELVKNKMSNNSLMLYDDIQDNAHFHDLIKNKSLSNWYIFQFGGKYIGLIGDLEKNAA